MTGYDLPSITGLAGTFSIKLFSDTAGLTVPTVDTFLSIGTLEEVGDISMGVAQASTLSLMLRDDYTTYSEGFWYKVFSVGSRIRFYLDQGGGNTFFFFGTPQADTIQWSEHYIGSTKIRTVSLDLVSVMLTLFETTTSSWMTEVVSAAVATGTGTDAEPIKIIRPAGLFAAMLKASGLNSSYDLTDVSFSYGSAADFLYLSGATEYRLDEVYVPVTYDAGADEDTVVYFKGGSNYPLSGFYPKLQALIGDLLRNFGVVMRMGYNTGTERFTIELIQRGRAYTTTLDFSSRETQSEIAKAVNLLGDAVRCAFLEPDIDDKYCWSSKKYADSVKTTTPPNYVDFDIDFPIIFHINGSTGSVNANFYIWDGVSGHLAVALDGIKYYNYAAGSYTTASATGALMQQAAMDYIYKRFTTEYAQVTRRYALMQANNGTVDDHTVLAIMQRTTIDLAGENPDPAYYINRVRKFVETNEVEVEWIKE